LLTYVRVGVMCELVEIEIAPPRRDLRRSHGERTRLAILDAAVNAASENGLESLTIGGLARALGMSKAGLFTHFGSKELMLIAIVEAARERFFVRVIEPALEVPTGLARLEALFEGYVGITADPCFPGGCFFGKASVEFENRPGPVRDRIVEVVGEWAQLIAQTIADAVASGELRPDTDVELLAFEWLALTQRASRSIQLLDDARGVTLARKALGARIDAQRAD